VGLIRQARNPCSREGGRSPPSELPAGLAGTVAGADTAVRVGAQVVRGGNSGPSARKAPHGRPPRRRAGDLGCTGHGRGARTRGTAAPYPVKKSRTSGRPVALSTRRRPSASSRSTRARRPWGRRPGREGATEGAIAAREAFFRDAAPALPPPLKEVARVGAPDKGRERPSKYPAVGRDAGQRGRWARRDSAEGRKGAKSRRPSPRWRADFPGFLPVASGIWLCFSYVTARPPQIVRACRKVDKLYM
jgi:hypothetical protein